MDLFDVEIKYMGIRDLKWFECYDVAIKFEWIFLDNVTLILKNVDCESFEKIKYHILNEIITSPYKCKYSSRIKITKLI